MQFSWMNGTSHTGEWPVVIANRLIDVDELILISRVCNLTLGLKMDSFYSRSHRNSGIFWFYKLWCHLLTVKQHHLLYIYRCNIYSADVCGTKYVTVCVHNYIDILKPHNCLNKLFEYFSIFSAEIQFSIN